MVQLMKKTGCRFRKKTTNRTTIWPTNPISGYVAKRTEIRISERYLHTHIHSSVIHHSQKLRTTDKAIHRGTNKENGVYTCTRARLDHKYRNADLCYSMDETWGHKAKWNKPLTERQILHDPTSMRYLESNSKGQKVEWWLVAGCGSQGVS